MKPRDLSGLDYFTDEDAAWYCRCSPSQFRKKAEQHGLVAFSHMGKKLYRKADVQRSLEREWRQLTNVMGAGIYIGANGEVQKASPLDQLREARPSEY
jgi:hypothetical protein